MLHLDGDTVLDQPDGPREGYVPLHTSDVVDFLALYPSLNDEQRIAFRKTSALILSLLHHFYRQRHESIATIYAPLDPDRDRVLRSVPMRAMRNELVGELFEHTMDALARANYHKLTATDIEQAVQAASSWGVRMRVNFDLLTDLEVYGRGHVIAQRDIRSWRNYFRRQTIEVPLYQRLVIVFRTSPELSSTQFDPDRVYLRMFKNVPRQDIDMMLPATGIQMTWLDHSKIVVPSVYAAAMTLWRFLRNVVLLTFFGVFKTLALVVLAVFAVGFGLKSMFTYRTNTQRRYMLNMAQSLYYQNLDNNAGVLLRLLEEGEQQDASESVIAYFVTAVASADAGPLSIEEIDARCEALIQEATGVEVDFDIESTARCLEQLGLFSENEHGWTATPLHESLVILDQAWDNWFTSETAQGPNIL